MNNFTKKISSIKVTEDMKERAREAVENGYGSQTEYVRDMWLAGESVVGDLDPRVGESTHHNDEIDSAEAAAKALDDGAIFFHLSDEKQPYEDVVGQLTQEFEDMLVDRLRELANNDQSAISTDGKGNYWVEE